TPCRAPGDRTNAAFVSPQGVELFSREGLPDLYCRIRAFQGNLIAVRAPGHRMLKSWLAGLDQTRPLRCVSIPDFHFSLRVGGCQVDAVRAPRQGLTSDCIAAGESLSARHPVADLDGPGISR